MPPKTGKGVDYSLWCRVPRGPGTSAHGVHPAVVGDPLKAHSCLEKACDAIYGPMELSEGCADEPEEQKSGHGRKAQGTHGP